MSDRVEEPAAVLRSRLLWFNAALLLLLALVLWALVSRAVLIGALVGNAFAQANVLALGWLMARLISRVDRGRRAFYGVLLVSKLGVVMVTIYILVVGLGVDVPGFAMGYSAVILALLVVGVSIAREQEKTVDSENTVDKGVDKRSG